MGLVWIKALTLRTGHANVIGAPRRGARADDRGRLDPSPLVTRAHAAREAPEAYAAYAAREALKIVLVP